MKKTNSIRQQLGVTQENLALLLKVSRSQLSMYELGKRDLPVEAKKQLAEMLQHAQKNSSKHTKSVTAEKKRIMLREKEIKRLLASNQYKTLLVERKIKALEKKNQSNNNALDVVTFLEKQEKNKEIKNDLILKNIKNKALKKIEKEGLAQLIKYQIKKECLRIENDFLKGQLSTE